MGRQPRIIRDIEGAHKRKGIKIAAHYNFAPLTPQITSSNLAVTVKNSLRDSFQCEKFHSG